jgi:hypothetical protein
VRWFGEGRCPPDTVVDDKMTTNEDSVTCLGVRVGVCEAIPEGNGRHMTRGLECTAGSRHIWQNCGRHDEHEVAHHGEGSAVAMDIDVGNWLQRVRIVLRD